VTHEPLPTLFANEMQMLQLFQNLIGNAVKYRRKESPCVHVSAQQRGKEWIFSIYDNGIGIEPENVNRIFDPSQRSDSSSKYQGTGIGLAICKKIVEAHKGRIWVASEPGEGSTFCFAIPLRDETSLLQQ
jgi:chemotaxis family two-component system sensor kinase Cph1